jgi:ParB family chromosome partitioning protein
MPDGSMLASTANTVRTGHRMLALADLRPSAHNPRKTFDADALRWLADSIRTQGILQNLVVRHDPQPDQPPYLIIAGERRYRAARMLADEGDLEPGAPMIPVKVVSADEAGHMALALLENLQRQEVPVLEEADGFAALVALDPGRWSPKTIAAAIGCSRRHVEQRLALVDRLAPPARDALSAGRISASQARVLTGCTAARQKEILTRIDRYPTVERLREAVTDGLIPVSRALFDVEAAGLELVTLDNGARYSRDREAFLRAQRAAAKGKVDTLKAEWAWAVLEEAYFVSRYRYEAEESTDRSRAGVIVQMDPTTGKVTFHTGLVARDDTAEKAASAAAAAESNRRHDETNSFRTALAERVAEDHRAAMALLLVTLAGSASQAPVEIQSWRMGLPDTLLSAGGMLAAVARHFERGERVSRLTDAASPETWSEVAALPFLCLQDGVAKWVADRLRVIGHEPLHPALAALAEGYGLPVPAHLQPKRAYEVRCPVSAPGPLVGLVSRIVRGAVEELDPTGDRTVIVLRHRPTAEFLTLHRDDVHHSRWHIVAHFARDKVRYWHDKIQPPKLEAFLRAWEDGERLVEPYDGMDSVTVEALAHQPDDAEAAPPLVTVTSPSAPVDQQLLDRLARALATHPGRGRPSLMLSLPGTKEALHLSSRDGLAYTIDTHHDERGNGHVGSCMARTKVAAFLRRYLKGPA